MQDVQNEGMTTDKILSNVKMWILIFDSIDRWSVTEAHKTPWLFVLTSVSLICIQVCSETVAVSPSSKLSCQQSWIVCNISKGQTKSSTARSKSTESLRTAWMHRCKFSLKCHACIRWLRRPDMAQREINVFPLQQKVKCNDFLSLVDRFSPSAKKKKNLNNFSVAPHALDRQQKKICKL